MLEKFEKLENDAQRFFAECWKTQDGGGDTKLGKVVKMMPNDSLQNVGKI